MLKLDFIPKTGETMPLVNNPLFVVTNIDGMTTADTNISSSAIGGVDGDTVNNIQANPRSIVIDLQIRDSVDVENAKREILKVVKLKQQGELMWTQNNRTVVINGIVESIEMPRWTKTAVMQITLHCEQPFWEDFEEAIREISESLDLHYFTDSPADMLFFPETGIPLGEYDTIRTKSFRNHGDVTVGLEIRIFAHNTVTNPIIYDEYGGFFGVGYDGNPFTLNSGEEVIITTHKKNKKVMYKGSNLYEKIKPRSTWLQLLPGDNTFSINSDDDNNENMSFSLIYKQRYI